MKDSDAQNILSAAPVSASALMHGSAAPRRAASLTSAALDVIANEPNAAPLSPIVVSGFARVIEFILVTAIGIAVYCAYVGPDAEAVWNYAVAILMISVLSILAFQSAELYDIQAYRRPVNQLAKLVSAWSLVFLVGTAISFFGKLNDDFSRVWFASFYYIENWSVLFDLYIVAMTPFALLKTENAY